MTTPDTSAVRAWARSNGYDVADRGRLPAELTDAYLAAQGGTAAPAKKAAAKGSTAKKAPARKAAAKKAPARKASATKAPAGTSTPARPAPKPAPKPVAKATPAAAPVAAAADSSPAPAAPAEAKPKPVADDRRLVALGEQLTALTARVAELEKALGSKPASNGVAKRFRRSR